MPSPRPFQPGLPPSTATIAVTNSSASVAVPTGQGQTMRVQNTGTVTAYLRLASSATSTAILTDTPIAAGAHEFWGCPLATGQYVHAICASGVSGTIIVTRGEGGL